MPKKTADYEAGTVTWDFEDGGDNLVLDYNELSEDIRRKFAIFGMSEKGGNTYAGARGESEKKNITPAQYAREQVTTFIKNMLEGNFRASTGGGTSRVPLAVKALAQAMGIEEAEAREIYYPADLVPVDGEPEDDATERAKGLRKHQTRIRNHPEVAVILEQWKLEAAQADLAKAQGAKDEAEFSLSDLAS